MSLSKAPAPNKILPYFAIICHIAAFCHILLHCCYGPSVISVMVTKGGHSRGNKLYRTSGTIGRGVAELYN